MNTETAASEIRGETELENQFRRALLWLSGPARTRRVGVLRPRWIFLRALALIYFSAFYSLYFQIEGLIGPRGILPVRQYLAGAWRQLGGLALFYIPSLLWLGSGNFALKVLCWSGMLAALMLLLNLWPRLSNAVCLLAFLSFVTAARDFSFYQSDGMLLAAGLLSLFFAPKGLHPGLGDHDPPSRASLFLLRWLWFRIYFESGLVKLLGGDPQWRHLTALDHYYENGPLPNWIGWYVQQLPHWFHAGTAAATLVVELGVVWMLFLPRRWRILCFFVVTPFQLGIMLTANLAFINHLTLTLGFLLLDDRLLGPIFQQLSAMGRAIRSRLWSLLPGPARLRPSLPSQEPVQAAGGRFGIAGPVLASLLLGTVLYVTTALLLLIPFPDLPLPRAPIQLLQPLRIANRYGLFGVMTRKRYEIEFQGSRDAVHWTPYPFRFKPQDPMRPPPIFAPYQPRFDWNLWFASLGGWRDNLFVVQTEALLLQNDPAVLSLFAGNPFAGKPPLEVRAAKWQYWFTTRSRRERGEGWWNRKLLGPYAPPLKRLPDGEIQMQRIEDWSGSR